ncbi:MAG: hypothetical protein WA445_05470, partial [Pseudolabrys sp.]
MATALLKRITTSPNILANADHFANVRYWHLANIGALQERRFGRYDALSEAGQRPHEAARLYNPFCHRHDDVTDTYSRSTIAENA